MTSHRTRRIGLAFTALCFVFLANNGCDYVVGLKKHPPNDNALRCECACAVPQNTRFRAIVASSDDTEQEGDVMNLTGTTLDLGQFKVGLRFTNLMIPRGANIQSALVQFVAINSDTVDTDLTVYAQTSVDPPTFSATNSDLSDRPVGAGISWPDVPTWAQNVGGAQQQTPELKTILQPLVDDAAWSNASAVVLRIEGTGHRRAYAFDSTSPAKAAVLVVEYDTSVSAVLPVCASEDVEHDIAQAITAESQAAECARVEETFNGLAAACGYPTSCTCQPFDNNAPDGDTSFQQDVCYEECTETLPDATCSNFDPNAFADCIQTSPLAECKDKVAATNATGGSPVCVASGSAFAYHLFGERSLCSVSGTSDITVGNREPTHSPDTQGIVEILGGPCEAGACRVLPYFDLAMEEIEFAVRYHSNPVFFDLSAIGHGLEPATFDGAEAVFGEDGVEGTGNGRRGLLGIDGMAVVARNEAPLDIGLDWAGKKCDMVGNIVTVVDSETPDGFCASDGTTSCETNVDCAEDESVECVFETDTEEQMVVNVNLLVGTIENQPPHADAGADQTIECTSPAGASFLIDGGASSDPDQNLATVSWRTGSRMGTKVSSDLAFPASLGVGQSDTFHLLVMDSYAQTDADDVTAVVEDTTLPEIACNAPATIRPPVRPISFTATATDLCDADVAAQVTAFDCFKIQGNGNRIDKRASCGVTFEGGMVTIRNKGGNGDHVQWTVRAQDDSGNVKEVVCEVVIAT